MALQFETGMQNLVYQMDAGSGRKIVKTTLAVLFAFAVGALYVFSNFQGFRNERAMDEAQLARNLALRGRLVTQSVRPMALGLLAEHSPERTGLAMEHPDLAHPPIWPMLLSAVFRATGIPQTGMPTTAPVHGADYVPVATAVFFTILCALWVWLIARKMFDARVATLSFGAFLVSDVVWRNCVLGTDLGAAMFFALGAVYAALWAAERPAGLAPDQGDGPVWRWLVPLALSSAMMSAAFLTRYAAGTLALAVFFFLGLSRRSRPWSKAYIFLGLAVLPVVPWMVRNAAIIGNPFGLVFHEMLAGTYLFPGDALFRTLQPEFPDFGARLYAVQMKMVGNLREFFARDFGFAGGGLLLGLFSAMYFHRFVRPASRSLRWCLVPAAVLLVFIAAAYGEESLRAIVIFWPLAIPYAWAFFFVLLDRLQFELRYFAAGAMALTMFLTGLPLFVNVLPPRTGQPYPPYFHRYIGWVSTMVEPEECLITDIPWAMAWYGGRTSILLPKDIEGFYEIHSAHQKISLAYFTTVTRNKPWSRELADPAAPEHGWYQIFAAGKVPGTFPLAHGRFIAGNDQFVLADRPRW